MMILRTLTILSVALLAFGPLAAFAEDWVCLNDTDGLTAFNSGDMKRAPLFHELKDGGARVQREHPQTYMMGQSRFIASGKLGTTASCEYSNHVGIVAFYQIKNVGTVKALDECENSSCGSEPHWRRDRVNTDSDNPEEHFTIHVCIVSINGYDFPSTACKFTGYKN